MGRPGDWPWQVQIDYLRYKGRYWCGGTLLNDEWILSAAHCFEYDLNPSAYIIALGEHNLDLNGTTVKKHSIDKIIMPPRYNGRSFDSDLALLHLKTKAS